MLSFKTLPQWHQKILNRLLEVEFPLKEIIKAQLFGAKFEILDDGKCLNIFPEINCPLAPSRQAVPVQGHVYDEDGPTEVLLFVYDGRACMFEVVWAEGKNIDELPPAEKFDVYHLKG